MSIQWYQLLFQIINFGVLVFLLNRFMYKPIVTIIKQRNRKIEDSIKAAEATLKEKSKLEEIKKKAIQEAEKEAVLIIDKAKKQANLEGKELIDQARDQAKLEVDKKFASMTEKLNDQEKNISQHLTDLVIEATSKVLKGSLTDKEQKLIIDQEIKKLNKIK